MVSSRKKPDDRGAQLQGAVACASRLAGSGPFASYKCPIAFFRSIMIGAKTFQPEVKQEEISVYTDGHADEEVKRIVYEVSDGRIDWVVIELRYCVGRPLLPDGQGGLRPHSAVEDKGFVLAAYLQKLVEPLQINLQSRVGSQGLRERLQAVVPTTEWAELWRALEKPWQHQRSAYYRHFKSKKSPEIFFGVEPRFTEEPSTTASEHDSRADQQDDDKRTGLGLDSGPQWENQELPVQFGFIHFATRIARQPRSESAPPGPRYQAAAEEQHSA